MRCQRVVGSRLESAACLAHRALCELIKRDYERSMTSSYGTRIHGGRKRRNLSFNVIVLCIRQSVCLFGEARACNLTGSVFLPTKRKLLTEAIDTAGGTGRLQLSLAA